MPCSTTYCEDLTLIASYSLNNAGRHLLAAIPLIANTNRFCRFQFKFTVNASGSHSFLSQISMTKSNIILSFAYLASDSTFNLSAYISLKYTVVPR